MGNGKFWLRMWLFVMAVIASVGCTLWASVELLTKGGTLGLLLIAPLVATWATFACWLTIREIRHEES